MGYNEAETRFHLIDPVLRDKGYDGHQRVRLETRRRWASRGDAEKGEGGRITCCVSMSERGKEERSDENEQASAAFSKTDQDIPDCRAWLTDEEIEALRKHKKEILNLVREASRRGGD